MVAGSLQLDGPMSHARCTYCSAPKRSNPGLLPAVERYLSTRITALWQACQADGRPMLILSGQYGLLRPEEPIPWYDHLMAPEEVPEMTARIAEQLRFLDISRIEYTTARPSIAPAILPYLTALSSACQQAGVTLDILELDEDVP